MSVDNDAFFKGKKGRPKAAPATSGPAVPDDARQERPISASSSDAGSAVGGGPSGGDADFWTPDRGGDPRSQLEKEFLSVPEGHVREGSLVIRPSMRAALSRFLVAFLVLLPFFLPGAIDSWLEPPPQGEPPPSFGGSFVNVAANFVIPFLISLGPGIQLYFTRYVFDDEGVRERTQLFSKTEKRVKWDKVTAVLHRRTLLDRLLQIERLDIVAYGARGTTLHLVGLREAPRLRTLVSAQMLREASWSRLFRND